MKHLYEYLEFEDLSDEAKKKAIKNVKNARLEGKYDSMDISSWVLDDDSLFEPPHQDMVNLFGEDYYEANGGYMIENTRKKISFVSKDDPNYYLQCKDAMVITNDKLFLKWLGFPPSLRKYVDYTLHDPRTRNSSTTILFEINDIDGLIENIDEDAPALLESYFSKAELKFEKHIDWVLTNITNSIESAYNDEDAIEDVMIQYEIEFDEDGSIIED